MGFGLRVWGYGFRVEGSFDLFFVTEFSCCSRSFLVKGSVSDLQVLRLVSGAGQESRMCSRRLSDWIPIFRLGGLSRSSHICFQRRGVVGLGLGCPKRKARDFTAGHRGA